MVSIEGYTLYTFNRRGGVAVYANNILDNKRVKELSFAKD